MTVASDLLQRHIETLLSPGEWEALIADDIVWELPLAPALGHIPDGLRDESRLRST